MLNRLQENKKWVILVAILLLISGVAHSYNMFHFPYYESDEGTYMSRAWSLLTQGILAPYTYWYDHAPAGSMLIAVWVWLTGGFFTFGFSLNSGRVLMLVIHVLLTYFVIKISKLLTNSYLAGTIAGLFFALSPLGIYFQRRILLDNMMIFWVLLSFSFLLSNRLKLSHIIISAVTLGIAILIKETAIFFIPAFLTAIYVGAHKFHRRFALTQWLLIVGCIVSLYFLYALLKGELFPYGSLLGGLKPHVSLLETLKYQALRGGGSIFDLEHSTFWHNLSLWIKQDPFITVLGTISNLSLIIYSLIKKQGRNYLGFSLLGLFYWFYLMRGGLTIEFYIIPLLPLLSIYIGILVFGLMQITKKASHRYIVRTISIMICAIIIVGYLYYAQISRAFGQQNSAGYFVFSSDQTQSQIQAIDWTRKNIDQNAVIVVDNYGYVDLHDPQNPSGKVFNNSAYYWTVNQDPAILSNIFHNSPETVDFVEKTPQMDIDLKNGASPLTLDVINHSRPVKTFNQDGWGVEIWASLLPTHILSRSWESYKKHFIISAGNTIDPKNNLTTSEGQSYGLLRAVWMNDKSTFDRLWVWTKNNLQQETGIFAWKWGKDGAERMTVLDKGSATDADEDIALALAFASKRWDDSLYLQESKKVQQGIWDKEVRSFEKKPYLLPGDWAQHNSSIVINPSYLAPYIYRVFAQTTPQFNWNELINTSYDVLSACSQSKLDVKSNVFLPPEWCAINNQGKVVLPNESGLHSSYYSYNAFRVPWRIALDYIWFKEPRAKDYLEKTAFLRSEWENKHMFLVGYTHDGEPWDKYESVVSYGANIASFIVTEPNATDEIYQQKIFTKFYEDDQQSYWEDPANYYTQNWAWFGTALYTNNLPNLWDL